MNRPRRIATIVYRYTGLTLALFLTITELTGAAIASTMAGGDVATVDTLTSVTGYRHLPPGATAIDGALRTRLEQVLVRRDGRWHVQSFHNVPVSPTAMSVTRPDARDTMS